MVSFRKTVLPAKSERVLTRTASPLRFIDGFVFSRILWLVVLPTLVLAHLAFTMPAFSLQGSIQPPSEKLEGVGVDEKLNSPIPLDLTFLDENAQKVQLRDFFSEEKPVALTLNYYECPMLCTLQLNGLAEAIKDLGFVPGKEFELVTVSINPEETPELARSKKQNYISYLGNPEASLGWHFLTGEEDNIRALADAVGFRYRYDPETGEFAHVAVVVVLTPQGIISRYLYGVQYEAKVLRLSLIEASRGEIGTPLDKIILYCYRYDASAGRYTPIAMNIVRLSGLITLGVLGFLLGTFWIKDISKQKKATQKS